MKKMIFLKKYPAAIFSGAVRYLFFISLSYVLLYPFLYIIVNSVKSFSDAYDATVTWAPKSIYFGNILSAFKVFDIKSTALNSFVYEIISAVLQFCSCAVAAYGLARFNFRGKRIMMGLLIVNILVPAMMIITPSYVNYSHMDFLGVLGLVSKLTGHDLRPNLVGTPLVFYLPSLLGVGLKGGLFIYIFNQFFKGLPKELEEAAWIDGAGSWKTFLRIIIPSSGPPIITVSLFSIIWHWNDLFFAQMYMNEPTLAVALNNFNANTTTEALGLDMQMSSMLDVPILLSGCLLFIFPMIVFYLIMQKRFMASIATVGIVG